jgi:pilus assembly protein Flp/PilA
MDVFKRLVTEEEGADATEYALMLGLIALAIIAAVVGLGSNLKNAFSNIANTVANNTSGS